MIARVYFWDGYRVGPMIQTTNVDLEERLREVVHMNLPGYASTVFVAQTLLRGLQCSLWNAPPARTVGQMYSALLAEDNWPEMKHPKDWQAGVFALNLETECCAYIGGIGFGIEEENPRQLRTAIITKKKEEDDEA